MLSVESASTAPYVGRFQRLLTLRTFPGWIHLDPREVAVIAEHTRPRFFPKGSKLLHEGQSVTSVHLIVDGQVRLERHGHLLRRLGPRTAAGGLAMLARDPEGYDCIAEKDTTTLELTIEDADDIFEDHFSILMSVLRETVEETIKLRQRMGVQAGFSGEIKQGHPCPARPLDLVERIFFLRQNMIIAGGQIDAIAELARAAREVRLEEGEVIWRTDEESSYFLVLVCGSVQAQTPDGSQSWRFGPGDFVGSLDSLAGIPRWYDATAEEHTVALVLDHAAVVDVWEDHVELPMELLRRISGFQLELLERATHPPPAPSVPV